MIGEPGAGVPETASVDLGIFDIFISDHGRSIRFESGGEKTDVGTRLSSPTKGLSIPSAGDVSMDELEDEVGLGGVSTKPPSQVSRRAVRRKKPKPKKTDVDWGDGGFGLTSVGGHRI